MFGWVISNLWSSIGGWLAGYSLVGIVGLGLYFFIPRFPLLENVVGKFRNTCGIVGVIALVAGWHAGMFFHKGEEYMVQKVAAKNKVAIERVGKVQVQVDGCNGGVDWDVTSGTCVPGSGAGNTPE